MPRKKTAVREDRTKCNRRGLSKKSASFFTKGHKFSTKNDIPVSGPTNSHSNNSESSSSPIVRPIQRHHEEYFNDFVINSPSNELSIPGADGVDGSAMVLRCIRQPNQLGDNAPPGTESASTSGQYNIEDGSILADKTMLLDLINGFISQHQENSACESLCLDIIDIQPWGVFSSVILTCKSCDMKSERTKLYEEIPTTKPGRKHAAGNMRLALVSQDMEVGPTQIQLLFAAVGIRAGSLAGLQKNAYKAADITEGVAKRDMIKWIEHAKDIQKDRGVENPDHISAQFDVVYHSASRAHARNPGQGASSATGVCIETSTGGKKIVAVCHDNKICLTGSRKAGKGTPIVCGEVDGQKKHAGCTNTLSRGQGIREYDQAYHCASELGKHGVTVTHLCTDSDATARDGFADYNKSKDEKLPPLHWYKDPSHLSRNMRIKITSHTFTTTAFAIKSNGQKWNLKERYQCRKALALDVPRRVSLTLSNMRIHWRGNTNQMKKNVDTIVHYMMKCYGGDHTSCANSILARLTGCTGKSKGRCWFSRSHTLRAQRVTSLDLSDNDKKFLLSVIRMKLSTPALGYIMRGLTTSKCEATNRAINKSLPKNKPFPRTSKGRVYSAIGRINNSFLRFTNMKFTAMNCPLINASLGYQVFSKYQRKRDITASNQKTAEAKRRRHQLTAVHTVEHFQQQKKVTNEGEYHKFQLDTAQQASSSALDALVSSEPSTSDAYINQIENALRLCLHKREVLDHSYGQFQTNVEKAKQRANLKRRSKRIRSQSARQTAIKKGEARKEGSKETVSLRMEHSYGRI